MKKVGGQRYLYQRGSTFMFRRGVPNYAREIFGGRREVQLSLRTEHLAEARYFVLGEIRRFENLLSKARKGGNISLLEGDKFVPSIDEVEEGVRLWFSDRMERSTVSSLIDHPDPDAAMRLEQDLMGYGATVAQTMAPSGYGSDITGQWISQSLIESNIWDIEERTPIYNRLLRAVGRGQVQSAKIELQDLRGEPRRIDDDTFSPDQYRLDRERQRDLVANVAVTIMSLFDGYVQESQPKTRTVTAWRRQIQAFIDFLGHDDAREVKHSDLVRWKEYLLQKTTKSGHLLNARTVRDTYMSAIKAVFRWAKRDAKIDINPTSDVHIRVPKKTKIRDRSLTDEEALTILRETLRPPPKKLSQERAFAQRWVPWLCAYSGARINEMTQLRREDVSQIDGVWVMNITPEAGSVKTDEARIVPLHPHLIEQGFIVEIARRSGPLFFDPKRRLKPSVDSTQARKVGDYLAKWVRDIGVSDPAVQPNHGWRHRFKTLARRYRMDAEVRDVIQGHAPRTEGEAYGGTEIAVRYEAIKILPAYKLDDPNNE